VLQTITRVKKGVVGFKKVELILKKQFDPINKSFTMREAMLETRRNEKKNVETVC
jgi:hypothetical protein